jgi:hypothetical protein
MAALAPVALGVLWLLFVGWNMEAQNEVHVFGSTGAHTLEASGAAPEVFTVQVRPGSTVLAQPTQVEAGYSLGARPEARVSSPVSGTDWATLLWSLAPFLAAVYGAWRLQAGLRRGVYSQLNFGVFKGAMPYELHASRPRWFRTGRIELVATVEPAT